SLGSMAAEEGEVTALASVDGRRILTGVANQTPGAYQLSLWDGQSGARLARLSGAHATFSAFAISPDGRTLVASTTQNKIVVATTETGAQLLELRGVDATAGVAFVNSEIAASAGADGRVVLWDLVTGRQLLERGRAGDPVLKLRVSPVARTVMSIHES